MSHVNTGVRKILENPKVYNLFHNITGGNKFRQEYFKMYFDLAPGSKVLDIGCGSGVMLSFIKEDLNYYGVDFEKSYIDYCVEKYGDRGNFVHQKVGEELKEDWFDSFDAVNAHGLLHHLSDDDCNTLLDTGFKYLKKGGYMVTFDTAYHDNQSAISKWLVSKDRGQNVKHIDNYKKLALEFFPQVDAKLYTNYSRLPYAACAMKMTK